MNLDLYNKVRVVPKEAQKTIGGGRLSGMTDINPMWRIKTLTEQFGACGVGWYYTIDKQWIETSMGSDEVSAFVNISLYYKTDDGWSMPVQGNGGSAFVAKEKGGLYVNDECFKMALTDAISVACKSLGFGADIYWSKDNTKYNDVKKETATFEQDLDSELKNNISDVMAKRITDIIKLNKSEAEAVNLGKDLCKQFGVKKVSELKNGQYPDVIKWLEGK